MKTIRKNTLIEETVTRGEHIWEYGVSENAALVLVFTVKAVGDVRIVPSVHLVGNGSKATVIGIVRGRSAAHVEIHTLQHHIGTDTTSDLLVKSVMDDSGICDYRGSIIVDRSAQKTDAYQRNENLLLGEKSRATSAPVLEILANDVRCTHGAVVKTVDPLELWYLESRGIDPSTARDMITGGFLFSAFSRIDDQKVRSRIESGILGKENI